MISQDIKKAIEFLRNAEVISIPTETVYGLAAIATNNVATKKIYEIKGRDFNKPLSIQVPSIEVAQEFAEFSDAALNQAQQNWPGPLTLVLKLKENHSLAKTGLSKDGTIGVRIPDHPLTLRLLKELGEPLYVPSANMSGQEPAKNATEVEKIFEDKIPLILDGGECKLGTASTILDFSKSDNPQKIR